MQDTIITVTCEDCGKEYTIYNQTCKKKLREHTPFRCPKCTKIFMSDCAKKRWKNISPEKKEYFRSAVSNAQRKLWDSRSEHERVIKTKNMRDASKKYWDTISDTEKEIISDKKRASWNNKSEEFKDRIIKTMTEHNKKWRESLSEEEKRRRLDNLNIKRREWFDALSDEDKAKIANIKSIVSKQYWSLLTDSEKEILLAPMREGLQNYLIHLSDEDKQARSERLKEQGINSWNNKTPEEKNAWSQRTKEQWANMSDDELDKRRKDSSIRMYKMWESLPQVERDYKVIKSINALRSFWENADEEALRAISNKLSVHNKERWDSMNLEERKAFVHKLLSNQPKNKLNKKFEHILNMSANDINVVSEYITSNNDIIHSWDYAIFDKDNNLLVVVDLDGVYYHADVCDYDGMRSKEEYDELRWYTVPENIGIVIIPELHVKDGINAIIFLINHSLDQYNDLLFSKFRKQPFPEPHYTDVELVKSWDQLLKMDCTDKYHQNLSLNTRLGDRLIQHFHTSIWMDYRKGELSPYEAWQDDNVLKELIRNHTIYQTHLNPNKILQGFNVSKIAPKVSVFSAGRAKMIIHRYLEEFDTIFDPFSGYSGRMLGAISLGKRYVGQDLSLNHVNESNKLMEFLRSKGIQFQAEITQKDILDSSGEYPCLFTCPPYSDKEQWVGVPVDARSCDDWIDECLRRFKCKRYVFVVDNTEKYADKVVDVIENKNKLYMYKESIIVF